VQLVLGFLISKEDRGGQLKDTKQVSLIPAFGILATAFLASMSVSSFFFIQPGDAQASSTEQCVSQGVITDGRSENVVELTVTLSESCSKSEGILSGVDANGIAYVLSESEQTLSESDSSQREVKVEIELNSLYEYYTFEIESAFSAKIESK
jgi:hypothetical protein